MRLKHAGSMQRFQSRSGHEAGARGAAAGTGHPGDMGDVRALRPSSPATPGCRRRAGESGAQGRILPAPAFEDALGQAIKASAPRGASRDVNVTSPATRQLPPLPLLALPHRTGCSQKWQMDACGAGRCPGRQPGGGGCGRNVGSAAGGSPRLHPVFIPVYRRGILVALKNVFANSFALTSRLSHLLSPAAPAGHGAHPARAGAHLARRRGCCMLSPHCGQHLRPQLSFVLTAWLQPRGERFGCGVPLRPRPAFSLRKPRSGPAAEAGRPGRLKVI